MSIPISRLKSRWLRDCYFSLGCVKSPAKASNRSNVTSDDRIWRYREKTVCSPNHLVSRFARRSIEELGLSPYHANGVGTSA